MHAHSRKGPLSPPMLARPALVPSHQSFRPATATASAQPKFSWRQSWHWGKTT